MSGYGELLAWIFLSEGSVVTFPISTVAVNKKETLEYIGCLKR